MDQCLMIFFLNCWIGSAQPWPNISLAVNLGLISLSFTSTVSATCGFSRSPPRPMNWSTLSSPTGLLRGRRASAHVSLLHHLPRNGRLCLTSGVISTNWTTMERKYLRSISFFKIKSPNFLSNFVTQSRSTQLGWCLHHQPPSRLYSAQEHYCCSPYRRQGSEGDSRFRKGQHWAFGCHWPRSPHVLFGWT